MNEQELQTLYTEFQVMTNTINQLEKQNSALENQLMELMVTNQSLEDMRTTKSGTDILVPLSSGIYAKAELKDNKNFLVNVGANVTLSKDLDTTKELIEEQIDSIQKLQKNLMQELQEKTTRVAVLEQEIKKIASTLETK